MDFYVFSNTKYLDFRTLIRPENPDLTQVCDNILQREDIQRLETKSSFILFANCKEDRILIGVSLDAENLEQLSSRYFYVDRNDGKTPTKISIVFVLNKSETLLITKELVNEIVQRVLACSWQESFYRSPGIGKINIKQDLVGVKPKRFFVKKKTYKNIDEMIYRFNSELFYLSPCKKLDVVYYLESNQNYKIDITSKIFF